MARTVISTPDAPKAIGPYSQAIRSSGGGDLLFCSGQIALDPATGEMVGGGDVRLEAERVMANVRAVLAAGGASLGDVVKTTIFLRDMADFAAVNEIYQKAFEGKEPPARSTVAAAGLPRNAKVEIEVIARVGA